MFKTIMAGIAIVALSIGSVWAEGISVTAYFEPTEAIETNGFEPGQPSIDMRLVSGNFSEEIESIWVELQVTFTQMVCGPISVLPTVTIPAGTITKSVLPVLVDCVNAGETRTTLAYVTNAVYDSNIFHYNVQDGIGNPVGATIALVRVIVMGYADTFETCPGGVANGC
jgi:hypothetical protein